MASIPTGTVTFLFSDIEGSTKLAQAYLAEWETLRMGDGVGMNLEESVALALQGYVP